MARQFKTRHLYYYVVKWKSTLIVVNLAEKYEGVKMVTNEVGEFVLYRKVGKLEHSH